MKRFGILAAGLCAALALSACNSTESQNTSAGAVGTKSACCADGKKCATECSGDAKTCAKGASCCKAAKDSTATTGNMGAVGEKKSGCCAAKSGCTGTTQN